MSGYKTDAIEFLQSSISRYAAQMDELQRRLTDGAGNLVERTQMKLQQEEIAALIEDAARLLSQLSI